jgi:translation initiation factor 2-alpha kinase 3
MNFSVIFTAINANSSQAGGQAGTRFYRPPSSSKICPKLDVYSLGVIAFELLNKCGTKTERAVVLSDLLKGIFPAKFEKHEMADGIKHMLWNNRDDRWGCTEVRKWLKGIIAKHEK